MHPIFFALLLTIAIGSPAIGAEPVVYQIVRPTDEAHNLLPKTCRVCHKEGDLHFFIVAGPSPEALEKAANMLAGGGGAAAAVAAAKNPHSAVACLFCHVDPPDAGRPAAGFTFRTLSGKAVKRAAMGEHCQLCHPEDPKTHPRVLRDKGAAADLGRAGLPLLDGDVLCTTCHDMHDERAERFALRAGYLDYVARSSKSYPHGNRVACLACHPVEPAEGRPVAFREADPTARCVRCHAADHGGMHPMAVKPSQKTYPLDFLDYPLDEGGRLSCSTCHDHPCGHRLDPQGTSFLRGGPYAVGTEFCYRCHPKAGSGALNPHRQVDEAGKILTTTCAFCHRRIPDPEDPEEAYQGPEDLLFVYSPVELCLGCHDPWPHPTGINHLVEMPEPRRAKLAAYEERHGVTLPLHTGGAIVCTTCHNPHDKGVLRGKAALGAAELHQWRVPTYPELCTPCHARYD